MSRGKYLRLEEAREQDQLKQFAKEHPTKGEKETFDNLLNAMALSKKPVKEPEA